MQVTVASGNENEWCQQEFSFLKLGDPRLERRFVHTAKFLLSKPSASIFEASPSWGDSKAAYRLFDNDRVSSKQILASHQKNTQLRMQGLKKVLVIQDTSFLNYHAHSKTKGLGRIGNFSDDKEAIKGLIMHTGLGISTDGVPLGIVSQSVWARDLKTFKGARSSKEQKDRESRKWLLGLDETLRIIPTGIQSITICDREADYYEFFEHALALNLDFLVRVKFDRVIQNVDKKIHLLWMELESQPSMVSFEVEVPEQTKKNKKIIPKRTARVDVRYTKLAIYPPAKGNIDLMRRRRNKESSPKKLELYVIQVIETDPPNGVEPVEWMLITSIPVLSPEDAIEKIEWYKQRWHIENFHKALKSGCQIEECRLQTADRLKRYITLFSIIAWRLYWMIHLSRREPDINCTEALSESEWRTLYITANLKNKITEFPEQPPTLSQACRWIAKLGGFKGRKRDGDPGIIVFWRGWEKLQAQLQIYDWQLHGATSG